MRIATAIAALLLGGLLLQPAWSDTAHGDQRQNHAAHHSGSMSPSEAARIAKKQYGGGRVLSVDHVDGGYRVKLLKKGEVSSVVVPEPAPAAGAPLAPPHP